MTPEIRDQLIKIKIDEILRPLIDKRYLRDNWFEEMKNKIYRLIKENQQSNEIFCQCVDDWTDGTFYCQNCHRERKR